MVIDDAKPGHAHLIIQNVPREMLGAATDEAGKVMPERAEKALHAVLSEHIVSLAGGKTTSIVITDVPREVVDKFASLTGQISMTPEQFFIEQLRATTGMREMAKLLVGFLNKIAPKGAKMLLRSVNSEAWKAAESETEKAGLDVNQFVDAIFEAAASGEFRIDTLKEARNGKAGDKPKARVENRKARADA